MADDQHPAPERSGHAEIPVPHDLQIELHDDPEAEAAFAALPPSHRRKYIDWIFEAGLPETRARRVEQTAERVKRGD